jgi:ketosteroid isomerase-like protein
MVPNDEKRKPTAAVEQIYRAWDDALGRKDLEGAVALYAPNATIESPLVRRLTGSDDGICRGREELRRFIAMVFERTPPERRRFRGRYFTDGKTVIWEYPRSTPEGEQMDFVEVMEIADGLITCHRVYWGWFGLRMLEHDAYTRR